MKKQKPVFTLPVCAPLSVVAATVLCIGVSSPVRADDGYHPYYYTAEKSSGTSGATYNNYQSYTVSAPDASMRTPYPAAAAPTPSYAPAPVPPTPVVESSYTYAPAPGPLPTSSTLDAYHYDAAPGNPPAPDSRAMYQTPKAHDVPPGGSSNKYLSVGTLGGWQLGAQISHYRYQEHDVADEEFMHLSGGKIGATADVVKVYPSDYFWGADVRLSYGLPKYNGGDIDINTGITTPSTANAEDFMFDVRTYFGHDFVIQDALWKATDIGLSPYIGFGFRYLSNNFIGADSNNVNGYARFSHYVYLPAGLTTRFRTADNQRLSVNAEYDQLLYGWQVSQLSDIGASDITNNQHGGYGLRGNVMYEWPKWSVGPFFYYWNINASDTACAGGQCGTEPHNQTIEYGLQGRYHF